MDNFFLLNLLSLLVSTTINSHEMISMFSQPLSEGLSSLVVSSRNYYSDLLQCIQ